MTAPGRALLALKRALLPPDGVRGRALLFGVAAAALSAALWGSATRLPWVAMVAFATQVLFVRTSPAAGERAAARLGTALTAGGMWAAIGLLAAGR